MMMWWQLKHNLALWDAYVYEGDLCANDILNID